MRRPHWSEIACWSGILLAPAPLAGSSSFAGAAAGQKVAQNTVSQNAIASRDVLVAGAGTVADGQSPAVITIDVGKAELPLQARLELSVSPVTISRNERFLLVVSTRGGATAGVSAKRLGSASFFPPPRVGDVRKFLFNVPRVSPQMRAEGRTRIELTIVLTPVNPDRALAGSSVRIVGARIVGG